MTTLRAGRELLGDRFVKRYSAEWEAEVRKARALVAAAAVGGFDAPAIIATDSAAATISYARLDPLRSIRLLYREGLSGGDRGAAEAAVAEAGRVLGYCHRAWMFDGPSWRPPEIFAAALRPHLTGPLSAEDAAAPRVALHGDYGFSNICVRMVAERPRITLIDPSPNGYSTTHPEERGPAVLDLAAFTTCLEGLVPLHWYPQLDWRVVPGLRRLFLDGYAAVTGWRPSGALLAAYVRATATAYLHARAGGPVRRLVADHILFNRWKQNRPLRYDD